MKCINLDWVEVHCQEGTSTKDADYFRQWYLVDVRAYGTPLYREMFTICHSETRKDGKLKKTPLIEIRRNPISARGNGGCVLDKDSCHIKLCNNVCYMSDPIGFLMQFLNVHGYILRNITRIDLALDFTQFEGDIKAPQDFISDYLAGKYSKINQSRISAHGQSGWLSMCFNSLKWGSLTSMVTTKLYNKSMELREVGDKPYIRATWANCGLPSQLYEEDGKTPSKPDVWRVEYSIRASKNFVMKRKNETLSQIDVFLCDNSLDIYRDRFELYSIFVALSAHYFDFRIVEYNDEGKPKRKDRCAQIDFFGKGITHDVIVPRNIQVKSDPDFMSKRVAKYLRKKSAEELDREIKYIYHSSACALEGHPVYSWEPNDRKYQLDARAKEIRRRTISQFRKSLGEKLDEGRKMIEQYKSEGMDEFDALYNVIYDEWGNIKDPTLLDFPPF